MPIDKKATKKTKKLYKNLNLQTNKGIMFGHEDDVAYGANWWAEDGRSDVLETTGSYPAVYGWDLGKIGQPNNIDSVSFKNMKIWMKQVYKRGGVNTVSWHLDNLSTQGDSWDKNKTVAHILPGGKDHDKYLLKLDLVADFFKSIQVGFVKVPILFRPFHEHNGDWFWWGKGNCTEEEYIQLWRFTIDYLRENKKVNNLLYIYSPDASRMDIKNNRASYLYGYPGDEYVDILGLDDYWNVGGSSNKNNPEIQEEHFITNLRLIDQLAKEKNKIATLSETGQSGLSNAKWFTERILNPIKKCNDIKLSYILVWRNANARYCFAPYIGHQTEKDFVNFRLNKRILFEPDIDNLYK